jgi:hypothetical protein
MSPPRVDSVALADGEIIVGDSRIAAPLRRPPAGYDVRRGPTRTTSPAIGVAIPVEGRWTPLVSVASAVAFFTLGAGAQSLRISRTLQ